MYIVSECLLGVKCKYNGGDNMSHAVVEFLKGREYISICPETMGGLRSPRPPAEIQSDGRVLNKEGTDVTAEFTKGAQAALKKVTAALEDIQTEPAEENSDSTDCMRTADGEQVTAILKANSPSCGCGAIYDGSFTGRKIPGYGLTARLFREKGIRLLTEEDF